MDTVAAYLTGTIDYQITTKDHRQMQSHAGNQNVYKEA
jgi:hypothetical protein